MKCFRATLVDNGIVTITLIEIEKPFPGEEPVSNYLNQSTVHLDGPGAEFDADETGIAVATAIARAALELAHTADLTGHPDIASFDGPENFPFLKFNRKAGCACGCSPGFLTHTRLWARTHDKKLVHVDVHVTVAWDAGDSQSVPAPAAAA